MTSQEYLTFLELCEAVGARRPSVEKALDELNIKPGRYDLSDRRRVVYPSDTAEKVKKWLLEHTEV